jgi:hypothetical protein
MRWASVSAKLCGAVLAAGAFAKWSEPRGAAAAVRASDALTDVWSG